MFPLIAATDYWRWDAHASSRLAIFISIPWRDDGISVLHAQSYIEAKTEGSGQPKSFSVVCLLLGASMKRAYMIDRYRWSISFSKMRVDVGLVTWEFGKGCCGAAVANLYLSAVDIYWLVGGHTYTGESQEVWEWRDLLERVRITRPNRVSKRVIFYGLTGQAIGRPTREATSNPYMPWSNRAKEVVCLLIYRTLETFLATAALPCWMTDRVREKNDNTRKVVLENFPLFFLMVLVCGPEIFWRVDRCHVLARWGWVDNWIEIDPLAMCVARSTDGSMLMKASKLLSI